MNVNACNLGVYYGANGVSTGNTIKNCTVSAEGVLNASVDTPAVVVEISSMGKMRAELEGCGGIADLTKEDFVTTESTNEVMFEHYMSMREYMAGSFDHEADYDENDIMQAVMGAYEKLYNKIVKEHENGDREVDYDISGKSKISLEEDLKGLDVAFNRCISDLGGYLTCKQTNEMFANPDKDWFFRKNEQHNEEALEKEMPVLPLKYTDEYINQCFSALKQAREAFLLKFS